MIVLQLIAGWFAADALSGIAHFIGDRTWIGGSRLFATFNADHHAQPRKIVETPFVERNLTNFAAVFLVSGVWLALFEPTWFLASLAAGGLMVAEAHRWAHAPSRAPTPIRWLQQIGLLQSPKQHARHHRPPHDVNFCLLPDWTNRIVTLTVSSRIFARTGPRNPKGD